MVIVLARCLTVVHVRVHPRKQIAAIVRWRHEPPGAPPVRTHHRLVQLHVTYRITRLVYYEEHGTPIAAIRREKAIKAMLRAKKGALIEAKNPAWDDLAEGWFDQVSPHCPGETT